jgi:hypothetical protein
MKEPVLYNKDNHIKSANSSAPIPSSAGFVVVVRFRIN